MVRGSVLGLGLRSGVRCKGFQANVGLWVDCINMLAGERNPKLHIPMIFLFIYSTGPTLLHVPHSYKFGPREPSNTKEGKSVPKQGAPLEEDAGFDIAEDLVSGFGRLSLDSLMSRSRICFSN